MILKRLSLVILLGCSLVILHSQTKRDPRAVALAGAYTTIADGIFAVGYNPALLAFQQDKPFMMQLVGFDFGFVGNYLSMANLNAISGDTLWANDIRLLLQEFENSDGLTFFQDFHLPLPVINYASGNMAFTSNLVYLSNYRFPMGILQLLLEGNAKHPELDMTLGYEVLGVTEYGFSFAVPYNQFAWGLTLKYLQGLFYLGVDPDSSKATLYSGDEAVYGDGVYFLRQGIGGSGLGLDVGFTTRRIKGWQVGFSIINALGSITWNKPSLMKDILDGSDNIYGTKDDLFHFTWGGRALNDSMAIRYIYRIDSLNAQNLSGDIFYRNSTEEQVVYDTTKNGKPRVFKLNYPAIFRVGVSKKTNDILISSDLWTGFEDRLFAHSGWRWAIGLEYQKFPSIPLRVGFAWGGADFKELSMGLGIHKGPLIFDFGFAFRNGIWIHTMQGLNLSAQLTITSFKSRKAAETEEPTEAPAPLPEETQAPTPGEEPQPTTPPPAESESLPGEEQ
ncbi:MAG: DUF5723 family protein [Fidelibacterota bacterium]